MAHYQEDQVGGEEKEREIGQDYEREHELQRANITQERVTFRTLSCW